MIHIRYWTQWVIYIVMDRACTWSGHRLFCYNRPLWINRIWGRVNDFRWYDTRTQHIDIQLDERGRCDQCGLIYDVGSIEDHCTICGSCWTHCPNIQAHDGAVQDELLADVLAEADELYKASLNRYSRTRMMPDEIAADTTPTELDAHVDETMKWLEAAGMAHDQRVREEVRADLAERMKMSGLM